MHQESPRGEPQTLLGQSSSPQAWGRGSNPAPWANGPALLTSDLQVGEGLHRNGDAERQQRERVTRLPGDIPGQVLARGCWEEHVSGLSPAASKPELQEHARALGVTHEHAHLTGSPGLEDGRGEGRVAKKVLRRQKREAWGKEVQFCWDGRG